MKKEKVSVFIDGSNLVNQFEKSLEDLKKGKIKRVAI